MKNKKSILSGLILCVLILCIFSIRAGAADAPARVLILPFQIHAEKDLSFLKKGISAMLSSRLASEGRVKLVNAAEILQATAEPATEAAALALGENLNVDFIAFGSVTIFGDSISTDARFLDVRTKKPAVVFNQSGKSHDDVIFHINLFADEINAEVFGRKPTVAQARRPEPSRPVDESRRNPEAVFRESGGAGQDYGMEPRAERSPADFSMWRSQNLSMNIKSMAVGDVDGDGNNEVVLLSDDLLAVYRFTGGRFQKLAEIKGETSVVFVTVDVADINANGKAEIFVTAEDLKGEHTTYITKRLRSFVLEWSGKDYVRIDDNLHWYFRVIQSVERGQILLGQKRGFDTAFSSDVYAMAWNGSTYEPADRLPLPKGANVYSFTYGDAMNSGAEMILSFSEKDLLRLYHSPDNMEWESPDPLGGSTLYFESPSKSLIDHEHKPRSEPHFLAQRIVVTDIDQDDKKEIIVANNQIGMIGKIFDRVRSFKSGQVECLFWDTLGLYPKWKTRSVSGYISDIAVADFDNDGAKELVFCVVAESGSMLTMPKSYLVSWKLKPAAAK